MIWTCVIRYHRNRIILISIFLTVHLQKSPEKNGQKVQNCECFETGEKTSHKKGECLPKLRFLSTDQKFNKNGNKTRCDSLVWSTWHFFCRHDFVMNSKKNDSNRRNLLTFFRVEQKVAVWWKMNRNSNVEMFGIHQTVWCWVWAIAQREKKPLDFKRFNRSNSSILPVGFIRYRWIDPSEMLHQANTNGYL